MITLVKEQVRLIQLKQRIEKMKEEIVKFELLAENLDKELENIYGLLNENEVKTIDKSVKQLKLNPIKYNFKTNALI